MREMCASICVCVLKVFGFQESKGVNGRLPFLKNEWHSPSFPAHHKTEDNRDTHKKKHIQSLKKTSDITKT